MICLRSKFVTNPEKPSMNNESEERRSSASFAEPKPSFDMSKCRKYRVNAEVGTQTGLFVYPLARRNISNANIMNARF